MLTKRRVLFCFLSVITGSILCLVLLNLPAASSDIDAINPNDRFTESNRAGRLVSHLYFSDKRNTFLISEERSLLNPGNPAALGEAIVKALIEGPQTDLMRTIPTDTMLKALYVTQDKIAYVDMSDKIKNAHPGGVKSEYLTIYSIVNSLILNIPEINAVKILINGQEATTLAGHVDLRFPFKADMLLIR